MSQSLQLIICESMYLSLSSDQLIEILDCEATITIFQR